MREAVNPSVTSTSETPSTEVVSLEQASSRRPIKTIVVGNNREFFSPIDAHVSPDHRDEFVQSDYDETDMVIMWHGDDKMVIVPRPIDPEFTSDVLNLFGYQNVQIVTPQETGRGLSEDILTDESVHSEVADVVRQNGVNTQIIPWGQTPQFQHLNQTLHAEGLEYATPETPLERGSWLPDYANTKIGTREILQRVQIVHPELGLKLPEGFPAQNVNMALEIANYFIQTGRGIVFKANLGGAGIGVFVFSPKEYDLTNPDDYARMVGKVRENELLQSGPLMVEEYITPNFEHKGVFPSVDSLVKEDGTPEVQAVSAMGIHRKGEEVEFYGSTIGKGLFTREQEEYMRAVNLAVGEEHAKLGYRGWYDTDFILAADGNLYLTESNVRKTGTTYMVDLAKKLFGEGWEDEMAMVANDKYIRPELEGVSYAEVKGRLTDIAYPINGERRGVIITQSVRSMYRRGKFGYVAIGETQEDAELLNEQLEQRMEK